MSEQGTPENQGGEGQTPGWYQPPQSGSQPPYPPQPPPQQYGYYGDPPVYVKTNGLAVASLIAGIAGILFCVLFVPSVLAVVFGHVSLSQIKRSGGHEQGQGMAVTGLVLGYLGVAAAVAAIIVAVNVGTVNTTFH